ncbi:tetratricopeptide repeat protein [Chryseolinea sp. H1M3-3]|uniref:tetratricopeptide repeat protein n=1 Tax=Chryseolinea sp. H1M3-3 TaxID=3034144 RepID=UPI0023EDC26B|nr:tetratricopeptide repeat protein [Chryseolinea sp. H1M3-3]
MQKTILASKYSGLIIMLVMSSFFSVAQQSAIEIEADSLVERQDYQSALNLYNSLLEKSKPETEEQYQLYHKRAVCYYGLQRFEEALQDINTLIEKYPQPQAKLLRAYINQAVENYEAQLDDLNDLLLLNPDNPEMLQWRASVLMESQKYAEAQKDIRKLLGYQASPELKSYLGLTYYYLENPDSALIIFDEVIKDDPTFIQAYIYAASVCLDEEAYPLALTFINNGLQADPANTTFLFYKGIALVETDQVKEGCRCLTKAFDAGIDDVADYLKTYCYQ